MDALTIVRSPVDQWKVLLVDEFLRLASLTDTSMGRRVTVSWNSKRLQVDGGRISVKQERPLKVDEPDTS